MAQRQPCLLRVLFKNIFWPVYFDRLEFAVHVQFGAVLCVNLPSCRNTPARKHHSSNSADHSLIHLKNATIPNGQQLKAKPQQHARSLEAAGALLKSVNHSSLRQLLQDTGAELAEKGIFSKHSIHGNGRARHQEDQ
jgi:hypothetical protein